MPTPAQTRAQVEDAWPVALPAHWFDKGHDASYWLHCFTAHAMLLSQPRRKYNASLDAMTSAMIVIASATNSPYHVAHELDPSMRQRLIHAAAAPPRSLAHHVTSIPRAYEATPGMRAFMHPPGREAIVLDASPAPFDFVVEVSTGHMHASAAMMRVVRSFDGDMRMMERAASFEASVGLLAPSPDVHYGGPLLFDGSALQRPGGTLYGVPPQQQPHKPQSYAPVWSCDGGLRAKLRCAFAPLGGRLTPPTDHRRELDLNRPPHNIRIDRTDAARTTDLTELPPTDVGLTFDWARATNVPMLHMIDQHAYRGIAHFWASMPDDGVDGVDGFDVRLKFIFQNVTG